jgi:hypothetical protein
MPADMQYVPKIARRQHSDFRAIMLDGDIGRDGRAVYDQRHVSRRNSGYVAKFAQPFEDAFRLVVRRARDLVHENAVSGFEDKIRVGAADINAYPSHGLPDHPFSPRKTRNIDA